MAETVYPVALETVREVFLSCWPKRTPDGKPCQIIVQTSLREYTLEPGNCPTFEDRWNDAIWANSDDVKAQALMDALQPLEVKDRFKVEVASAPEE